MMTSTALDLEYLTEAERDLILSVIRKDEELHNKDQIRIDNLKSEIKAVKVKGALKPGMDAEKSCARCREPFGWIFDRGELCSKCKQKVCEACQCVVVKGTDQWICVLCKKQKDLDTMSGAWFFSQFRKSKRNKKTNQIVSGTEIVKSSFRKNSHAKMNGTRTTEDVRRALAKGSRGQTSSPDHEGESSDTQSMEAHSPRRYKKSDIYNTAVAKDSEKIMLLDLLGGPSVAPMHQQQQIKSPEPLQPKVHVQHISTRRYSDSSSGSEGISAPSSPQFSHRTESEYAPSESINSSFRSTSAVSSDGRCTMVTDNASVISGISTAPPSMQESPNLSSRDHMNYAEHPFNIKHHNSSRGHSPYDSGVNSSVVTSSAIDQDRDDHVSSSDSVSEHLLRYQHLKKSSGEDVPRVQTVKVVSRGRSASDSSSSDDDQFIRSNNNNTKPYQPPEIQSSNADYKNAHFPIEKSWNRSSGSDSSRTTRGLKDNSDGLSLGSESCAETGSTIDAPVLDPPNEFNHIEAIHNAEVNPDETLVATEVEGQLKSHSGSVNGIDDCTYGKYVSQPVAENNLASMKEKINDLLSKYNIQSSNGDLGHSSSFQINQNVHKIAPIIKDDFDVIDTPPMSKKPRLNHNSANDSNVNFETGSTSSFEDIECDVPFPSEPIIEELEWDSTIVRLNNNGGKTLSEPEVSMANPKTTFQTQQSAFKTDTILKPYTKNYSDVNREGDFLSDKSDKRYPQPDENQLILPSHLIYQIDGPPSRESDDYSDSLSVITERTEPEDDDFDSDDSDAFDKRDLPVIAENQQESQFSEGEDFDEMFQANLEVLGEHKLENTHFKPVSVAVNENFQQSKQVKPVKVNPEYSISQSKILEKQVCPEVLLDKNEKRNEVPLQTKTNQRDFEHAIIKEGKISLDSRIKNNSTEVITKNEKNPLGSSNNNNVNKVPGLLERRDTLALLADEELNRASLKSKRESIDLNEAVSQNIVYLDEEDKKELHVNDLLKSEKIKIIQGTQSNSVKGKTPVCNTKTEKSVLAEERRFRGKLSREDTFDILVNEELNNKIIAKVADDCHNIKRQDTLEMLMEEELRNNPKSGMNKHKGLIKQDTITVLAKNELNKKVSKSEEHKLIKNNNFQEIDSNSQSQDNIPSQSDEIVDDSHISSVALLTKQFDGKKFHLEQTFEKPNIVVSNSVQKQVNKFEHEEFEQSPHEFYPEESDSCSLSLDETDDYVMTLADLEDLGELLASEIMECAVYGCKDMIMLHNQMDCDNEEHKLSLNEGRSPTDCMETNMHTYLENTKSSSDQVNFVKDEIVSRNVHSDADNIVVDMIEFENIQSPTEQFKCETISGTESILFSEASPVEESSSVKSYSSHDTNVDTDATPDEEIKQNFNTQLDVLAQATDQMNSDIISEIKTNDIAVTVAKMIVDDVMNGVMGYFDYHTPDIQNKSNVKVIDSSKIKDPAVDNSKPSIENCEIDSVVGNKSLLENVMEELNPAHILRKQPHKSPVISREVMHPAYQKHSLGRRPRPSSTGSNDSASYLSDSDQFYHGIHCSTPSRNSSAYIMHPNSAGPSPTGTPYGSLGRQKPKCYDENDEIHDPTGIHETAEDSDVRSDIHSDFKSDEQQSHKNDERVSVKSDVHSVHSLKSEGKSDSGFVKQDSISSARSVPSLCVTDTSPVSNKEEEEEAEDDIDDLVTSFKSNKALSKSHGQLHNPQHTNLMSSFSSSVESVTSIYSEAGEDNYGNIPVEGEIQFGMDYKYKSSTFEISVKQCRGIAAVDTKRKRSDPYVKTYLLPDRTKSGKRKSRVRKHTLNPVFNEVLKYHIAKSELESRTLWVTIWNNDTFGKNDFLGEVTVPLDYQEFKDTSPKWYQLQDRSPVQTSLLTYKGDLNIALKYVTADSVSSNRKVKGKVGNKGELQVLVKQARNLTAVRSSGTSDPFCKGYLLPEKTKGAKQKTHVMKKNCNPQWNHTFVFEDVTFEELKERSLELTIWDHDRFTSNDFLGGVRLGLGIGQHGGKEVDWSDARGEEISVWQSMLDRPNYWIEQTLLLRPNMNSRKPAV